MTTPLPGRVFDPERIPDGSRTVVDLATGELVTAGPSEARARRLAARQRAHDAQEAQRAERLRQAALRGVEACREALPPRPTPIGLARPGRGPLTARELA